MVAARSGGWRVVGVYELDPVPVTGGAPIVFRVEVQERVGATLFRGRVWRIEHFKMRPSFGGEAAESHEETLVLDPALNDPMVEAGSEVDVLRGVGARLERQLSSEGAS